MVLDSRTLRSTPESGGREAWDRLKRTRGSKLHMVVDTLGQLLALHDHYETFTERVEPGGEVKGVDQRWPASATDQAAATSAVASRRSRPTISSRADLTALPKS